MNIDHVGLVGVWSVQSYRATELLLRRWQGRSLCPNQCLRVCMQSLLKLIPKVSWLSKNFPFLSSSTPASIKRVVFAFIVHSVAGWDKKVQSTFSLYWAIRGCQIVSRPRKSVKGMWSGKGTTREMMDKNLKLKNMFVGHFRFWSQWMMK